MNHRCPDLSPPRAWRFVVLLGAVSLLSDLTFEGARSVSGPFLGALQAGPLVIGLVSGLGEFLGYGVRLASGRLTDRLGRYWPITFTGYAVNLLAMPCLALAGSWPAAAALLLLERLGKALRTPARDAMLSHAAAAVGRGRAFGLHKALDQVGAILGPLFLALLLQRTGDYRQGFALLALPAGLALLVLLLAARLYPHPQRLEGPAAPLKTQGLGRLFWWFTPAGGLMGAGFADFPLLAFHLARAGQISVAGIASLYALAMAAEAGFALLLGRLYDRRGLQVVIAATLASAAAAPLIVLGGVPQACLGVGLWGVGRALLETVLKAVLADLVPPDRRATGYGVYAGVFGACWCAGSALMGWLSSFSLSGLALFSLLAQAAAVPLWLKLGRDIHPGSPRHAPRPQTP